jgi:putative transposase
MTKLNPFRYFRTSPEVIRYAVMLYVRFPLSLRNVEDLLHERGIDVSHETIWFWWQRFGPIFAAEIRLRRAESMRAVSPWRWHLDEMFLKINEEWHYLWRAIDLGARCPRFSWIPVASETVVVPKTDPMIAITIT